MSGVLEQLKRELEAFGKANDAAEAERGRRMLNITRETGELLSVLVRAAAARRILEIGTSNGYSTLWLAEAAQATGGTVTTVERSSYKAGLASANLGRSGLAPRIKLVQGDAASLLRESGSGSYDLVFLDSERSEYCAWWPLLGDVLRPGGLMVADNATSHAGEMEPFLGLVRADAGFTSCIVPVGNGEFLAVKGGG